MNAIYVAHRLRWLGAGARRVLVAGLVAVLAACGTPTSPEPLLADFVVDVSGERFVLRISDPDTIRAAADNLRGANRMFPIGPLRPGNGGFNAPWSWHFDPSAVRFAESAIELCDGRPSYVETHQSDYATYCPWGARVVGRR